MGEDFAPTAGTLADEARRGAVPDVDAGLEVGVGASVRHRAEVEGGRAVYARPLAMVAEAAEERGVQVVGKCLVLARVDDCQRRVRDVGDMDWLAVAEGGAVDCRLVAEA